MISTEEVDDVHRFMQEELEKQGAHIDGIYVCPHEDGECDCRKPEPGLFYKAEQDFPIDKDRSWMVGDSDSDVEAGKRYGVRTIQTGALPDAVKAILEEAAKEKEA